MKIYGRISYTIDRGHPDIRYIPDWSENKIFTFEDIYTFDNCYTFDDMVGYIKNDLSLIAGGGYNSEHIHNVTFDIKRI